MAKARALRQLMLDFVIDLINKKTGGGTKYINQRDKDFLYSSLQEDTYRRQFTDAIQHSYEQKGRVLTRIEAEQLFREFENMLLKIIGMI